jgi:hypothetical protein
MESVETQTCTISKTTDAQKRATAKWRAANKEYVTLYRREMFRLRYSTDEEYRKKYMEKNLAWYHKTKSQKAAAAAAAAEAAKTPGIQEI